LILWFWYDDGVQVGAMEYGMMVEKKAVEDEDALRNRMEATAGD